MRGCPGRYRTERAIAAGAWPMEAQNRVRGPEIKIFIKMD